MKAKTHITDFSFRPSGHGHYEVTYTSPVTRGKWKLTTSNMDLIDSTKNADDPKRYDLDFLKYSCKNWGTKIN